LTACEFNLLIKFHEFLPASALSIDFAMISANLVFDLLLTAIFTLLRLAASAGSGGLNVDRST
jgi:hypothetical protein